MRKIFIIIWFLYLPLLALSQGKEVRVYYDDDRQHLKERYFVKDNDPSVLYGSYESFYLSGELKSKGQYINDETYGLWKYYYENGHLKMAGKLKDNSNHGFWTYYYENNHISMQGDIYDGKREGKWQFFYETGVLKSEGVFKNGVKDGLWTYYYEDKTLKAKAIYDEGDGLYKEFYQDGALKMEGYIKEEKSDSLWVTYYEDGTKKSEGAYEEGEKNGPWMYYYPSGALSSEGSYSHDLSDGKWTYYHENGEISAEGAERDGKREGYWKLYYDDGQMKGEGIFEAGSGDYKEYYESGKIKVKGTIVNGSNEGKWIYFYENGKKEGEADFTHGVGEYTGFYEDGTEKMKGTIKEGNKVGTWELYNTAGDLAGYYKPFYEDYEPILRKAGKKSRLDQDNPEYKKPEYRYKSRKFKYFVKRNSDYGTIIVQVSPFTMLFGDLQVAVEYNVQERIGYELVIHKLRNPFFSSQYGLGEGDNFFDGFGLDFRQRFYHKDSKWGMPYFGHALQFSNYTRFEEYRSSADNQLNTASMNVNTIQYGVFVGSRILQNINDNGFTFDLVAGVSAGYQNVGDIKNGENVVGLFSSYNNNSFIVKPIFGLSLGYVFGLKKVNTRNP